MPRVVEIKPSDGRVFVESFGAIVSALPEPAARYNWYLADLYGEADMPRLVGKNMSDVVETIKRTGVFQITWEELRALSQNMSQIFDLLVVGLESSDRKSFDSAGKRAFDDLCQRYEVVIEALDSYKWRIGGLDQQSVDAVAGALRLPT